MSGELTGEEILEMGLADVHEELQPGAVFDPATVIGIVTGILTLIKGCSQAGASRQIRRGKGISKRAIKDVLIAEGYRGDAREAANRLAKKGRSLTEQDIKAIIQDSNDIPVKTNWWPAASIAIAMLLLLPANTMANWWPSGQMASVEATDMWPTPPRIMARDTRIILETQDNCGPCKALIEGPIAELERAGFTVGEGPENHIQIVNVTGTDHGQTPTLNLIHHGKEFAELIGADHTAVYIGEWFNTFIECGKVPDKPKPVKTVSGSGVPSGGSWAYYGSGSLGGHLVRNHGYSWSDVRGKSHGQLVYLHSYAHNKGRPYRVGRAKVNRIAKARTYCPTCPR